MRWVVPLFTLREAQTDPTRLSIEPGYGPVDQLEPAVKTFVDRVAASSRTALVETKAILATCGTTAINESADVEANASERCLMEGNAPVRLTDFFAARRSRLSPTK
jgi:hypothetical protein